MMLNRMFIRIAQMAAEVMPESNMVRNQLGEEPQQLGEDRGDEKAEHAGDDESAVDRL